MGRFIAIYGGTFDPPHQGHLHVLAQVREHCHFDHILVFPAARPSLRRAPVAASNHRLAMVKLAMRPLPGVIVDEREFNRPGPSFTIDSIESLRQEKPDAVLNLLMGVDVLKNFERWHRWQDILGLCNILAITRPGWILSDSVPEWWCQLRLDPAELRSCQCGAVSDLSIDPSPVSATAVREMLAADQIPGDGMLAQPVLEYILEHRLYR